ncbi:MAG: helix-turn-helix transcriptional regulator [Maribacter sp.]
MTGIFNFLMIAGAVQGFVFNIFTFLSRKRLEKPIIYLNLFVLFLSLNNLQSWLVDQGFVSRFFFPGYFLFPWYLLIVPMFYAFLIHYLGLADDKRPFLKLSLLFFMIAVVLRILVVIGINGHWLPQIALTSYNFYEDIVALSYSIFFYCSALQLLYRSQNLYRPILAFDDLNWIRTFLGLGAVVLFLWFFAVVINLFVDESFQPYSNYPLRLSSSILIYWIGYQGFFRYVVLQDRIELRNEIRRANPVELNEHESELKILKKHAKSESKFKQYDAFIRNNQKFLDPYLSLDAICEELDTSTSSLSKLVNSHAGENFADYINRLRVEQAKKLLSDHEFSSYTIVSIGLECGFNSKSTFYTAFKKFTKQTPTQYRNSYL